MKIKTSEATPLQLNYLVAVCEGKENYFEIHAGNVWYGCVTSGFIQYHPSTDWSQGGPIIERKIVSIDKEEGGKRWAASAWRSDHDLQKSIGPTPLIAAMRCYVASQLGDEVEIPDYLLTA